MNRKQDPAPGKPVKEQKTSKRKNMPYVELDDGFLHMSDSKVADTFIVRKGNEFIAWILKNDKVTTMRPFWHLQGIHPDLAEDWTKRNSTFKQQWAFAKDIIGDRREDGALHKTLAERTHLFTASHYLKEYRALEEWREAIKAANDNGNTEPLKILIEKFSSKKA